MIADAIDKVGKDGVVNVEEGQTFGMDLEFTEGMQFDKGYISPYMVTDQDRMEARPRGPLHPDRQPEDRLRAGHPAGARAGHPVGQADPDHRRGRRGRGARDARRQQAPRHLHRRRGQGARLRRPPQAHARGHRDPHGRRGDHRGDGPQAREHAAHAARPCPPRRRGEGQHHDHRRRRRQRGHQGPHQPDQERRSRTPTRTSTARSCRSAWPSWPAALRWSRSALPPRPR